MGLENEILNAVKEDLEAYEFDKSVTIVKKYSEQVDFSKLAQTEGYHIVVCMNNQGVRRSFYTRRIRKATYPVEIHAREIIGSDRIVPIGLIGDLAAHFDKRLVGSGISKIPEPDPQSDGKQADKEGLYSGKLSLNIEVLERS